MLFVHRCRSERGESGEWPLPIGNERAPQDVDGRLQHLAGGRQQVREGHPGELHDFFKGVQQ